MKFRVGIVPSVPIENKSHKHKTFFLCPLEILSFQELKNHCNMSMRLLNKKRSIIICNIISKIVEIRLHLDIDFQSMLSMIRSQWREKCSTKRLDAFDLY